MPELNSALKTIIEKGVTLSKEEVNRSYLFSSFKRTVSSWNSDLKKAKEDDTKLKNLIGTMKKDAIKYLDETKQLVKDGEGKEILVKNPKLYKKINEAKQSIITSNDLFNHICTIAQSINDNDLVKYYNQNEGNIDLERKLLKKLKQKTLTIGDLKGLENHNSYLYSKLDQTLISNVTKSDNKSKKALRKTMAALGISAAVITIPIGLTVAGIAGFIYALLRAPILTIFSLIGFILALPIALPILIILGIIHVKTKDDKGKLKNKKEKLDNMKEKYFSLFGVGKDDLEKNKPISKVLEKPTKELEKLNTKLSKLEVTDSSKKSHGTNKVKYMQAIKNNFPDKIEQAENEINKI